MLNKNPKFYDFTATDLTPVVDKKYAHLIKCALKQQSVSFKLSDVNRTIANGLRRTMLGELLVKAMKVDMMDITQNDPFLIHEMICSRIAQVPIDQSVKTDAVFTIDVTNKEVTPITVYAESIRGAGNLVDPGMILFDLNPGKFFRAKITIYEDYAHNFAAHTLVSNAVSLPLDQKPIDLKTKIGIPSSMSDPREYEIRFITSGAMDPRDIIFAACENIIARVRRVGTLVDTITASDDEYHLVIDGESDTIGMLFADAIYRLYENIDMVTPTTDPVVRRATIRIKCAEDVKSVIESTVKYIVEIFTILKKQIHK